MGTRTRWREKKRKLNPVIRIRGYSEAGQDQGVRETQGDGGKG